MPLQIDQWEFNKLALLLTLSENLPDEFRDDELCLMIREELNRRLNPHANDAG